MPANNFYPSVSNLISASRLPLDKIPFTGDLVALLDLLFYRNLLVSQSTEGDVGFYALEILSYKEIGFEIPGTEMKFLINPDLTPGGAATTFPLSLSYQWPIIKIVDKYCGGVPVFFNDYSFGKNELDYNSTDLDLDYGKNFNWFHNLMAVAFEVTQTPAPNSIPTTDLDIYRNNKTYYELYRKYWETSAASRQTTIMLTEKQLSIIVNEGEQEGGNSILHIFDVFSALPININNDLPVRDFDRTTTPYYLKRINFVGLLKKNDLKAPIGANNFFAVSDYGYSPPNPQNLPEPLKVYDDNLHKMQERIGYSGTSPNSQVREDVVAWYSPFHKETSAGVVKVDPNFSLNQIIDTFSNNELGLTPYDRFRQVARLQDTANGIGYQKNYLLYDIETGGNALSNNPTLNIEDNNGKISTLSDDFPTIENVTQFQRLANSGNLGINGLRILLANLHQIAFGTKPSQNSDKYLESLWELIPANGLNSSTFDLAQIDKFKNFGFGNKLQIKSKPTGFEIWKTNYQNVKKFHPNLPNDNDLADDKDAWTWDKTTIPAHNWDNIKKNQYRKFLSKPNQNSNSNKRLLFLLFINRSWIIRLLRDSIFDTENNNCQP